MDLKILDKRQETLSVLTYIFEKPESWNYHPGQFIQMEIPHTNQDNRGTKRSFSLASSPTDNFLQITQRHGVSSFKQALQHKKIGDSVSISEPMGKFYLNEDPKVPAVFLAGGIGITPFHSMIKYTKVKKVTKPMTIIYSNKTSADFPFYKELVQLDEGNEFLKINWTITQEDENWTGRKGRINEAMIREIVGDLLIPEFYIVGLPIMTIELKRLIQGLGVNPKKIHFELFTGY